MGCRRARRAISERRLGLLTAVEESWLRRHVAGCDPCAAELRLEQELARDLALLRVAAPGPVDVTVRVMRDVGRMPVVERLEVPGRQFGWAVLAAAAAFVAIVAVAAFGLPVALPGAMQEIKIILGSAGAVVSAFARPAPALVSALQTLGGVVLQLFRTASPLLEKLQPVSQGMVTLLLAAMISITTFVLARDLRLLPVPLSRKER